MTGAPGTSSSERFLPLARKLSRRYGGAREPFEDLLQVASLGLVKAVDRFDTSRGTAFSSFAVPTIMGEIKRYFRDQGWAVHVPRGAQERAVKVEDAQSRLSARTGHAPTVSELAEYLEFSLEEVLDALETSRAHHAASLDAPSDDGDADSGTVVDTIGAHDPRLSGIETRLTVGAAAEQLSDRERRVLALRFVHDLTQTEIARADRRIPDADLAHPAAVDRPPRRARRRGSRTRSPVATRVREFGPPRRGASAEAGVRTLPPTVRLELESRPQVLTIVRGMLAGVAEPLAIEAELLDDVKTAVSEACNNVVLHAYGGQTGPMDITVFAGSEVIRIAVTDRGMGMPASPEEPGTGIGLSVIRALAETVTIDRGPGGGTCIEMEFAAVRRGRALLRTPDAPAPDHGWPASAADEVTLSVSPISLLASVLGRMARTLAATAHFSLDRFSDVYLVTDALAAHAGEAALDGRIDARLCAGERRLELEVGPFRAGASDHLAVPATGTRSPLALLSDEMRIERGHPGDRVRVVVIDRRQ